MQNLAWLIAVISDGCDVEYVNFYVLPYRSQTYNGNNTDISAILYGGSISLGAYPLEMYVKAVM